MFSFVLQKGREFTMNAMWDNMRDVNLTKEIQSTQVPLYFFEGAHDMATPIEPVKTFFDSVIAEKGKTLIVFENSGHFLMVEEKEKYQDLLVNVVLKESLDN
jgi:pimeloyl-ACP methyl ester carboxylesterase